MRSQKAVDKRIRALKKGRGMHDAEIVLLRDLAGAPDELIRKHLATWEIRARARRLYRSPLFEATLVAQVLAYQWLLGSEEPELVPPSWWNDEAPSRRKHEEGVTA